MIKFFYYHWNSSSNDSGAQFALPAQQYFDELNEVEQSSPCNNNLTLFYNNNKDRMSKEELKQAIINYVKIFRYDQGSGYFFIHEQTTVVEHPIFPKFKGKDFALLQDQDGVYFVKEFYNLCKKNGSGILHYKWKHAKTKLKHLRSCHSPKTSQIGKWLSARALILMTSKTKSINKKPYSIAQRGQAVKKALEN